MPYNLTIQQQKQLLRTQMKKKRDELSQAEVEERSNKVLNNLWQLSPFKQAESVFCYVSFRNEVETLSLIKRLLSQNIAVAVPKIEKQKMIAVKIKSVSDLVTSKLGTLEPESSVELQQSSNICLTPGLAFSVDGGRLGWGGGYYDAYFKQHPDILKIGLAYDFQVVDQVPTDENDQNLDLIVTESEIIHCSSK